MAPATSRELPMPERWEATMSRVAHDQLSKGLLSRLLATIGEAVTAAEVSGEVQQVDVLFTPARPGAHEPALGLLGELVADAAQCLIEPFSRSPSTDGLLACVHKQLSVHAARRRANRRGTGAGRALWPPRLLIIAPTISRGVREGFGARPLPAADRSGVFRLAERFDTLLIAANLLPRTPETLWIRLLGRGRAQQEAVEDLLQLLVGHPYREVALEELSRWYTETVRREPDLSREDKELLMNTESAYEEWRTRTINQGLKQGLEQGLLAGRRATILRLANKRFGAAAERVRGQLDELDSEQALASAADLVLDAATLEEMQAALTELTGRPR